MLKRRKKNTAETKGVSLITLADQASPISEEYRTIRTNIQYTMVDKELKTLVVTSSNSSEGKSICAANLAVVFAKAGRNVLLIDADMRKPTVAKTFGLSNSQGLSTLLSNKEARLEQVVHSVGVERLSVMTSGPKPPNPSELLDSLRMGRLIQELKEQYDLVIFDISPVLPVTDSQIMASKVDGTILVIREKMSKKDSALKAKSLLQMAGANVIGVIYNGAKKATSQNYYYGL